MLVPVFMSVALALAVASPAATSPARPLAAGDAAPSIEFTDIENQQGSTHDYRNWVQVLTFADRESSEDLKVWMEDAQIETTKAHPELRVAYLSFADLAAVPRFLRGVARPVLAQVFESSNEQMAESYRKMGIEADPDKVAFVFTPDWDGGHLATFGIEDATKYHCWIVADGKVVAALNPSTPDIATHYKAAFDQLVAARAGASAKKP